MRDIFNKTKLRKRAPSHALPRAAPRKFRACSAASLPKRKFYATPAPPQTESPSPHQKSARDYPDASKPPQKARFPRAQKNAPPFGRRISEI